MLILHILADKLEATPERKHTIVPGVRVFFGDADITDGANLTPLENKPSPQQWHHYAITDNMWTIVIDPSKVYIPAHTHTLKVSYADHDVDWLSGYVSGYDPAQPPPMPHIKEVELDLKVDHTGTIYGSIPMKKLDELGVSPEELDKIVEKLTGLDKVIEKFTSSDSSDFLKDWWASEMYNLIQKKYGTAVTAVDTD